MLNEQKIKKMRKLTTYESGKGRKQLRISKYYRSDYIGLSLIKNFFLTTIAYGLLLLVYFGSKSDYLMDNINQIDEVALGVKVILFYLVMIAGYSIITYVYCSVKYRQAQEGVEEYYQELSQLKKMYDREETKAGKAAKRRKA